jgi:hypothetical protein
MARPSPNRKENMSFITNLVLAALIYFLAGALPFAGKGFISYIIWAAIVFGTYYFILDRYPTVIEHR